MEFGRRRDIYSAILPLYYVFKIFGFIPFTLDGQIGARKFNVSYLGLTYSIVIGIVSLICYGLFFFYDYSECSSEKVFSATENLHSICHLIFLFVLYLMFFIKNRSILDIINKLSDINIVHSNYSYRIWHMILVCWIFILFLSCISAIILVNFIISHNIYLIISQNYLFISFLIFNLIEVHFINIMFWLKKYFSTINSTLCDVMNTFQSSVSLCFNNLNDLESLSKIVNSTKLKLKHLMELHSEMCYITEFANSTYDVKILIIMADKFRACLIGVYFFAITVLNYDRGMYTGHSWSFTAIVVMGFNIVQFILVLWCANAAVYEVSVYFDPKLL